MKKSDIKIILLLIADIFLLLINFLLINNLGSFEIDTKINILSFVSFLVTVVIAFLVPFLIKKAIDDKRGIKSLLINEIMDLISIIEKNHKIISDLYSNNINIENKHRNEVLENFFDTELKIDSIRCQFEISYPSKNKVVDDLFNKTLDYKHFLTDGSFMLSFFTNIDHVFFRNEKNAFSNFKKSLMIIIHEIHKF